MVPRDTTRLWTSVASSDNGTRLIALVKGGQAYTSTNSGLLWTPSGPTNAWSAVASSADGMNLVAVDETSSIQTSTDGGFTWTLRYSNNQGWRSVASSADGTRLIAGSSFGQVYTSTNSGINWTAEDSNRNWTSLAMSADGTKVVAVADGKIFASTGVTTLVGPAGSSATLQYIGNGQWQALGQVQIAAGATVGGNGIGLLNGTNVFSGTNQFTGLVIATNPNNQFGGNGANLTNLDATTISTGTLADARLSANVALLDGTNTFSGMNQFTSQIIATNANNQITGTLIGDGSGLTNLSAASLTSTVADARLSTNVAFLNGTNTFSGTNQFAGRIIATNANNQVSGTFTGNGGSLTNLNAANLTSTVADARLSANVALLNSSNLFAGPVIATNANNQFAGTFTGNGSSLTNLNATNLTGTVADARLSSNIGRLNGTNTFSGTNQFAGRMVATNANNQVSGTFTGNGGGLTSLATANLSGTISQVNLGTTASYTPSVGNGSANFALARGDGYYAKIGNLVYFETWVVWTNKGSATSGTFMISLPVPSVSGRPVFNVGYVTGVTFNRQLTVIPMSSTAMGLLEMSTTGGGGAFLSVTNFAASGGEVQITGTYRWQ
jgi:hypothetical protein